MVHVFMFQNLLFACALTSTLGLATLKEDIKPSYKSDEVSFHLHNKKMVSYNDDDYEITLSLEELSYSYENFAISIDEHGVSYTGLTTVVYNNVYFSFGEDDGEWLVFEPDIGTERIYFVYHGDTIFKWFLNETQSDDILPFEYGIELHFDSEQNYLPAKTAIELDIQANNSSDNMPQVLDDFVGVLTTAIGSLASGIAGGVTAMAQDLFLQEDAEGHITGLSVFGGIVALFAGLALAVAITTKVYTWVTTLGN